MKPLFLRIFPVLMIASMMLASCSTPAMIPNTGNTFVPTAVPAPSATSTAPQSDDVWDRILANNKIVVGTSWDYPPFSSVVPNFQAVGFDIALVEEIGRRLQIPVDAKLSSGVRLRKCYSRKNEWTANKYSCECRSWADR